MYYFIFFFILIILPFSPKLLAKFNERAINTSDYQTRPSPQLMLASTKSLKHLPSQTSSYYVSEKYDGVRAFWTGSSFLTRKGYVINAPKWYTEDFPAHPLDGELWVGHNQFDAVSAITRRYKPIDSEWRNVNFMVFDTPISNLAFHQRKERIQTLFSSLNLPDWIQPVNHLHFEQKTDLAAFYQAIIDNEGEGVMLNVSNATYQAGRSKSLLKVKPLFDDEAEVTGYHPGTGKYFGLMGSLWVKTSTGQEFKIGSGFSDEDRRNPPQVGQTITFQYSGLSKHGLPRFARFLRVRNDI